VITTDHRFFIGWSCCVGFNACWPTTETAGIVLEAASSASCWGIRSSGLPKPAKVPSIPMSAIYQMKLLVPAQQGTDAASPPGQGRVLIYLLEPGLEVGGTPKSAESMSLDTNR
jgi:hypothetical protein